MFMLRFYRVNEISDICKITAVGNRLKATIAKMLEDCRKSFPLRIEAHARSVFLQREIRQRMMQNVRESEKHHIGQNVSSMGMNDELLTRTRREMLIASLLPRP